MAFLSSEATDPQRYSPPDPLLFGGEQPSGGAGSGAAAQQRGVEVRLELFQSHAFLNVGELLRSYDQSFSDGHFSQSADEGVMCAIYTSSQLRVIYYSHSKGRDELGVCWADPASRPEDAHNRLREQARQLAEILGGGTNVRLMEHTPEPAGTAGTAGRTKGA